MRTIKITTARYYVKTAVVEIPCPENLALDEVADYLYDNRDLFDEKLDSALFIHDRSVECMPEMDNSRYDVVETKSTNIYGGTL
jgi:hypothetical protein